MPFAAVAGGVASAVVGSALSGGSSGSQAGASAADPFASQRGQYQTQLQALMTGKNADGSAYDFTQDPSYQYRLGTSMSAVEGNYASKGMLNSGNRLTALEQNASQFASTEYANQFSRLSQLSGANVGSPAAAGQIIANGNAQQMAGASQFANTLGGAVTSGVNSLMSGGGSGATGFTSSVDAGSDYGVGGNTFGFTGGGTGSGASYSLFGYGG